MQLDIEKLYESFPSQIELLYTIVIIVENFETKTVENGPCECLASQETSNRIQKL